MTPEEVLAEADRQIEARRASEAPRPAPILEGVEELLTAPQVYKRIVLAWPRRHGKEAAREALESAWQDGAEAVSVCHGCGVTRPNPYSKEESQ